MTIILPAYPDIEDALCVLFEDIGNTGTETPLDLQGLLPFIRFTKHGGSDDGITDRPRIDVDNLAETRAAAFAMAGVIQQRLIGGPNKVGATILDKALTSVGPFNLPWADPNITRYTASYVISARR